MTFDEFVTFLDDEVGFPSRDIGRESSLQDELDWDSLSFILAHMSIEAELGLQLPLELISAVSTVGDLHVYVEQAMERQNPR